MNHYVLLALVATLGTWLLTALGAATVVFFKEQNKTILNIMLGFAAGVMIAASFWSLLQPAIEQASEHSDLPAYFVATIGFLAGAIFMWASDKAVIMARNKADNSQNPQNAQIQRIVMLVLSIAFVSEPWKKEDAPISLKWAIYAGISFLTNGICTTVQKLYQITDKGAHSSEFMISSLSITLATILIFVLLYERKGLLPFMKKGLLWPFLCGASNGVANQLTMILAVALPASFLYPVQSAGAIIITAIASIMIYREKLSLFQKIGFVSGVLAIVAFNI